MSFHRSVCAAVPLLLLLACGGNEPPSSPSTTSQPPIHQGTTTTMAVALPHENTFTLRHKDGYTATMVLRRGELTRARAVTESLAPCVVNRESDAALPFTVRTTNTTPNYETTIGARIGVYGQGLFWNTHLFQALVHYTSGAECNELLLERGVFGITTSGPVATGAFIETAGWFIIEGYYGPATPDGNPDAVREVLIRVLPPEDWQVVSGTGATQQRDAFKTWVLPLDPASDGGLPHQRLLGVTKGVFERSQRDEECRGVVWRRGTRPT